jgi:hypothetical protein
MFHCLPRRLSGEVIKSVVIDSAVIDSCQGSPLWSHSVPLHSSMKPSILLAALFVVGLLCFELWIKFCTLLSLTIFFACAGYLLQRGQCSIVQSRIIDSEGLETFAAAADHTEKADTEAAIAVLTFHLISKAFPSELEALDQAGCTKVSTGVTWPAWTAPCRTA